MDELVNIWERPGPGKCMIAGWNQWADAGSVSSGLPQDLIQQTDAQQIGEIGPGSFYLFQIPATHHFLRPVVDLEDGYRQSIQERSNEFFYADEDHGDFVIFLGEEPHQAETRYCEAFLDVVEELEIERVAIVAGVFGPVPHDRNREISCVYSLPEMKEELEEFALRFSNYEGGATIGTVMADRAEYRGIECVVLYAIAPAYQLTDAEESAVVQQMSMDDDYKAWYDIMLRLNHMFGLDLDLADLKERADEAMAEWDNQLDWLAKMPDLGVAEYLAQVYEEFEERTFVPPLSEVWARALDSIMDDDEDDAEEDDASDDIEDSPTAPAF